MTDATEGEDEIECNNLSYDSDGDVDPYSRRLKGKRRVKNSTVPNQDNGSIIGCSTERIQMTNPILKRNMLLDYITSS